MCIFGTLKFGVLVGLAGPVLADSAQFPAGHTYIIQLESSVVSSGLADYHVPPLVAALEKTGLKSLGGPDADYVVTLETYYDTGRWVTRDGVKEWLYERKILLGLSRADFAPNEGVTANPAFGVEAFLMTPNEDRLDELACLVDAAMQTLVDTFKPEGRVKLDAQVCER